MQKRKGAKSFGALLAMPAAALVLLCAYPIPRPRADRPDHRPPPRKPASGTDLRSDLPRERGPDQYLLFGLGRKTNSFITSLTREDFTVYEDNKKQEIINFNRETNLPLTIALLIDTSQSVAPKLKFEQEAAINFFQSVLKDQDRAMLVEFDSGVSMIQDFTNDPNLLAKKIRALKAAGGTALYDALYLTCDEKLIRETGRKTIVILSDGEDTASRRSFEEALEMALRAEATIYAISTTRGGFFGVDTVSKEGDRVLRKLAEETGGRIFLPFKVEELENSFRQISQELRSQYNIGYISSNPARDGGYRRIEVRVAEKDTRVNFRKGYYAPTS